MWDFNIGSRTSKLQKKAVTAISNSKTFFKESSSTKGRGHYKLSCLKWFVLILKGNAPGYYQNMFQTQANTVRLRRTRWTPQHLNNMENNLPNNNNYDIQIKHTNSKYCCLCSRYEIPKIVQETFHLKIVL